MDEPRSFLNKGMLCLCAAAVFILTFFLALDIFASEAFAKVTIAVGDEKVAVTIEGVGKSGAAELRSFASNEYPAGDAARGIVSGASKGEKVGTYSCGTTTTITLNRFDPAGTDALYKKFYVLQGNTVLAGPYYATETPGTLDVSVATTSKKGVFSEDTGSTLGTMRDLGVQHTTININLNKLLLPNETAKGRAIDNSRKNVTAFKSNGKTYYFDNAIIGTYDDAVRSFSAAGIEATAVVLASNAIDGYSSYPRSLAYVEKSSRLQGFNTSNNLGRDYWIASMEFLAQRYSGTQGVGTVSNYVIGNEIDQAYYYFKISENLDNVERTEKLSTLVEEFGRCVRLANNAVKKYTSNGKVIISTTHHWTGEVVDASASKTSTKSVYAYRPKDIIDLFASQARKCGDYDWGLSHHSYCTGLANNDPGYADTGLSPRLKGCEITGDMNNTPSITLLNLEVLEKYLEQPELKFNGEVRSVYLTEVGVSSHGNTKIEYETQAAYIAQFYYRAANLKCVKAVNYYRLIDNAAEGKYVCFGLLDVNGSKKNAYEMYKWIDTEQTFTRSAPYLKRIRFQKNGVIYSVADGNIRNWQDVMRVVDTPDWDWGDAWKISNIIANGANGSNAEGAVLRLAANNVHVGEDLQAEIVASNMLASDGVKVSLLASEESFGEAQPYASASIVGEKGDSVSLPTGALRAGEYRIVVHDASGKSLQVALCVVQPHQWHLDAKTKDSTCLTQGTGKYTCTVCHRTEPRPILSLGHKWNSFVTVNKSKHTHTERCAHCGATSWNYNCSFNKSLYKKATKKTNARYKYRCILCGHSYVSGVGGTVGKQYKVNNAVYHVASNSAVTLVKAKNSKKVTVGATVTIKGVSYKVTKVEKGAFAGSKIKTVTLGANVSKLAASAFKGSRVTTVVVKSKKLAKASAVKSAFKGAKVKTVKLKVDVGASKENKSYFKKFKKAFTKKNCGVAFKVTR